MPQPLAITEHEVMANDLTFDVRSIGPGDGPPVILLHGYPQSAGSWDEVSRHLAAAGHRVIAPNLRGYSPGANPQDVAAYRREELVGDVRGLADALGVGRFHLAGHDWGGGLAWSMAAAMPERIASLAVVSTPHPLALTEAMRTSTQMLRSGYFLFFRIRRLPEVLLSAGNFAQLGWSLRASGLPKAAWARDRARLRTVGLTGPLNWYRAATTPRGWDPIGVPTLYIRGTHDWFLGTRAAELTAKHVAARYEYVPINAGHWIPDRNAAALLPLLDAHFARNPV